jgi:hypothetical protein
VFRQVLTRLRGAIDTEAQVKRETPALVLLMTKPRTDDKGLKALGDLNSTYHDSFSENKELEFVDYNPEFHHHLSHREAGKTLNKASQILSAGTPKGTFQTVGYRGHIPANMKNLKKLEHGMGEHPHPVYNNLVLSQRGMGCVLGYTGGQCI